MDRSAWLGVSDREADKWIMTDNESRQKRGTKKWI